MDKTTNASKGMLPFKVLIIILTVAIIGIIAILIFMNKTGYLEMIAAAIGYKLTISTP